VSRAARARVWVLWLLALAGAAATMMAVRARLDEAHVALVFLLVVLGGSAAAGRALGVTLAVTAFLVFNFLFLPPFHTLAVTDPLDWLVLVAFLVTGVTAAQLLYRAQAETETARRRAEEVDRLAALGAETLSVGRAEEALAAITRVIRTTLGVAECEVRLADAPSDARSDARSDVRLETPDAAPASHTLLVPLHVRDRTVGTLRLADPSPIALDPRQRRFLDALAHYAALGVERARLSAEAERAEALREADRFKDALLASVSHDIRTPLTTIRALAHDIAAEDPRALVIEEEVERLNRFVADLLDMSRLTAGAVPLAIAINAAEDLIGAALQRVDGMSRGRTIRAALQPSDALLVGRFDFVHALRIVVNLLENALKYAPPDAPIDLAASRDGDALLFTVADRGPGIAAGQEERIFERFHWQPGTPPDARGAGLGLAIARGLAEAQGGTLRYLPRAGGGSVFELRLPAAELSAAGLES
jgi:two-component system sensor histidine kinase KdpD